MKGDKYKLQPDGRIWLDVPEPELRNFRMMNEFGGGKNTPYQRAIQAYNSRPNYAVSKELNWEVGQVVEEGKDFELLHYVESKEDQGKIACLVTGNQQLDNDEIVAKWAMNKWVEVGREYKVHKSKGATIAFIDGLVLGYKEGQKSKS